MRKNLALLLSGLVLGIGTSALYNSAKHGDDQWRGNEIVDFIISAWTQVPVDEVIDDGSQSAQLSSGVIYRLGYIPDTVRALALMVEEKYKVPHSVTIAQWMLESRWGKSDLGANNVFGHTYAATRRFVAHPRYVVLHELVSVDGVNRPGKLMRFTVYSSIKECFDVHGQYLSSTSLYRAAFLTSDAEQFARIISCYYAQAPDYATKLITIIRRYKL